jgi:hypothetical protein
VPDQLGPAVVLVRVLMELRSIGEVSHLLFEMALISGVNRFK